MDVKTKLLVGIVVFVGLLGIGWAPARASEPAPSLRALFPVPSSGSEWIVVENPHDATISGKLWSIKDTVGSTKTWILPDMAPNELKIFPATQTKISLNNTGDQVQLLFQGVLFEESGLYGTLAPDAVWVLLDDGWQAMSLEEWEERWPRRDWTIWQDEVTEEVLDELVGDGAGAPSPTITKAVLPKNTPVPTPSASPQHTSQSLPLVSNEPPDDPPPTWWKYVLVPRLGTLQAVSSSVQEVPIWEREPADYTQEWQEVERWKQNVLLWSLVALVLSGMSFFLCFPKLWDCYNGVCLLDVGF